MTVARETTTTRCRGRSGHVVEAAHANNVGMQLAMAVDDKSNREKNGSLGPFESFPPSDKGRVHGNTWTQAISGACNSNSRMTGRGLDG